MWPVGDAEWNYSWGGVPVGSRCIWKCRGSLPCRSDSAINLHLIGDMGIAADRLSPAGSAADTKQIFAISSGDVCVGVDEARARCGWHELCVVFN